MKQEYHKIEKFGANNYAKIIFGEKCDPRLPDIISELSVLNSLFPSRKDPKKEIDVEKALSIFKFLYDRYYDGYIWNSYEELYIRTSLRLMNDFTAKKKGSDNQFLSLLGPSNIGKTHRGTAFYLWLYLMNPIETRVILTSNKISSTMQRVWSDFVKRFKEVKRHYPQIYTDANWILNNSRTNMMLRFIGSANDAVVTASSLNKEVSEEKTIDSLIGFHGLRYFIFIDESTSCSTAIHGTKENLANNTISHIQLSGNPNNPHNLLGHTARPEDGYEGFDWDNIDVYRNSYGRHIYFNPEKSPSILDPDPKVRKALEKHKYPTVWSLEAAKKKLGTDNPDYFRFVLGRINLTQRDAGLITQRSIDLFDVLKPVEFSPYAKITKVVGFDPSTGHSYSDLSALIVARVGLAVDGTTKICFGAGDDKYTYKLTSNKDDEFPPLYQMVHQARDICNEHQVDYKLFGTDVKPLGISDIIFNEWTKDVRVIDGGGKAHSVKYKKNLLGAVPYNKITECYLQLKQFIECGLVGGIPEEVLPWLHARKVFEIGDKLRLEGKAEFTKRTRLGSPDLLDAIAFCLDTAIWNFGFSITRKKAEQINQKKQDHQIQEDVKQSLKKSKEKVKLFNTNNIRRTSLMRRKLS